jgi:transglutaminase-like putative cysteine protease
MLPQRLSAMVGRRGQDWANEAPDGYAQWWLIAALSLAVLPHLFRLPPWITLTVVVTLSWRALAQARRVPLPGRGLLALLTVLTAGAVVASSGALLGPTTGTALLAVMTGLKLLETRRKRDAVLSTYLGFLLVATYFFVRQEPWVLLYLVATVLALLSTLVALNRSAGTVRSAREVLRPAATLMLQALPLMVALFLLVPRLPGPLWGHSEQGVGITGLSEEMAPGSISQLVLSDDLAFRTRFQGTVPPLDAMYWRGPVLWEYQLGVWRQGPTQELPPPVLVAAAGTAIDYSVLLEPHGTRWLPALDMPLPGKTAGAHRGAAGELLALRRVDERRSYQASSQTRYQLQAVLPPRIRQAGLQLAAAEAPRLRALAAAWRAEGLDDSGIVRQALDLIRQQPFRYTLEPPALQGDPVDSFFFDTRAGFCEHYASAFTVLMRAAGIPARVATGYLGAHPNPLSRHWLVYQADAHAWSEVWLAGRGWVRVDPTAAVAPGRVQGGLRMGLEPGRIVDPLAGRLPGAWLYRLAMGWDALEERWNRWVLGYDRAAQHRLWLELRSAAGWLLPVAAAGLVLAAALLWWQGRPPARPAAETAFARYCARLARVGLARRPSEGPRDFGRRVAKARPDLAQRALRITSLYERLTFAPPRSVSPRALEELLRLVAQFRPRPPQCGGGS